MNHEVRQETILVLQGGGALGAYECGVYKALEEKGIRFDVVAGVSIGAVNAAIIAGNRRGEAAEALERFWKEVAIIAPPFPHKGLRRTLSASISLLFGNPHLFIPRWFIPSMSLYLPFTWTSLYDTCPIKRLLEKYIDCDHLSSQEIRLFVTAVNVETGEMEIFDSFHDRMTADHIVASGSLPPGLPWTRINGKAYWDGAIVSNTPLMPVLDRLIAECVIGQVEVRSKMVYLVDLFPKKGPLPTNIWDVMERHKDILYSDKIESDTKRCRLMTHTVFLIKELLSHVPEDVSRRITTSPWFREILCHSCHVEIIRIAHSGEEEYEFHFKDYDFSYDTIQEHIEMGYQDALQILGGRISKQPA